MCQKTTTTANKDPGGASGEGITAVPFQEAGVRSQRPGIVKKSLKTKLRKSRASTKNSTPSGWKRAMTKKMARATRIFTVDNINSRILAVVQEVVVSCNPDDRLLGAEGYRWRRRWCQQNHSYFARDFFHCALAYPWGDDIGRNDEALYPKLSDEFDETLRRSEDEIKDLIKELRCQVKHPEADRLSRRVCCC